MILPESYKSVFDVQLTALADLWTAVNVNQADPNAIAVIQRASILGVQGNSAVIVQQAIAASGLSLGFLPGEAYAAAITLVSFATGKLSTGEFLQSVLAMPVVQMALQAALQAVVVAMVDVLQPVLSVITIVPVAGQIAKIAADIIIGIVKMAKMAKAEEAAANKPQEYPPSVPSVEIDRFSAMDVVQQLRTPDWQQLFEPLGDVLNPERDWERGFACSVLTNGGRRIAPFSPTAYNLDVPGFGYMAGASLLTRWLEFSGDGRYAWDTGAPMVMSRQACEVASGLLFSDGPTAFAVDATKARIAWERYISEMLATFDNRTVCKAGSAGTKSLKAEAIDRVGKWLRQQWGIVGTGDQAVENAPVVQAFASLESRQAKLLRRPVVPYIPEGTPCEPAVSEAKELFLQSEGVCWVDVDAIPDDYYRTRVEIRRASKGAVCFANVIGGLKLAQGGGPSWTDGDESPLPPPPTLPNPQAPEPASTPAPRKPSKPSKPSGGVGLGVGFAAAAIIAALAARR